MVNFKIYDVTDWTTNNYNTSESKGNQAMKFGQLIKWSVRNIFCKNHAENETGRLVPDLFLLKKALYKVKASG